MLNKKVSIFIIVIISAIIGILYLNLREYNLSKDTEFKKVNNADTSINDIEIYIRNILGENKILISDKNDTKDILNNLCDTDIQRKIIDEKLMGVASCRLTIKNVKTNNMVNINISKDEIIINNKKYNIRTNNDIFEIIKNIITKYDEDAIQC